MKSLKIGLTALALVAVAPVASASTTSFSFACFTNNSGSCSTYASQFQLDITELTPTTVEFKFLNLTNPPTGFITEIYFDTNTTSLTRVSSLAIPAAQPGVSFTLDSSPTNSRPPGSASFNWANNGDTDFQLDPDNPAPTNGVNPGEQLIVTGVLGAGVTYAQLIASFTGPTTDSRIGMHVQGIGQFSEGMYATVVPVPGALPMMLGGLIGLGVLARRRVGH
jgi:hypothetical protein